MAHTHAEYLIEEVPATGERIKLGSHSITVFLSVGAANRDEAERWVRERYRLRIRGPVEFGGSVVERSVYALCSGAHPLPDGESICMLHIGSAAHAATAPGPDSDVIRKLIDRHFGE